MANMMSRYIVLVLQWYGVGRIRRPRNFSFYEQTTSPGL
jgi:hypothetical protein